jgi:hypothetical protein
LCKFFFLSVAFSLIPIKIVNLFKGTNRTQKLQRRAGSREQGAGNKGQGARSKGAGNNGKG